MVIEVLFEKLNWSRCPLLLWQKQNLRLSTLILTDTVVLCSYCNKRFTDPYWALYTFCQCRFRFLYRSCTRTIISDLLPPAYGVWREGNVYSFSVCPQGGKLSHNALQELGDPPKNSRTSALQTPQEPHNSRTRDTPPLLYHITIPQHYRVPPPPKELQNLRNLELGTPPLFHITVHITIHITLSQHYRVPPPPPQVSVPCLGSGSRFWVRGTWLLRAGSTPLVVTQEDSPVQGKGGRSGNE